MSEEKMQTREQMLTGMTAPESVPLTAEEMEVIEFLHQNRPPESAGLMTVQATLRLLSMARAGIAAQAELNAFKACHGIGEPQEGYRELIWREASSFYEGESEALSALRSELTAAQARAERAREEAIREAGKVVIAAMADLSRDPRCDIARQRLYALPGNVQALALLQPEATPSEQKEPRA